jgi:hypothetical protein
MTKKNKPVKIFFPKNRNGKGLYVARSELNSSAKWLVATLKKHHFAEGKDRPYCTCMEDHPNYKEGHPTMQVYEHSNRKLYLKRNPNTGLHHHPSCSSYGGTKGTVSNSTRNSEEVTSIIDGALNVRVSTSLTLHNETQTVSSQKKPRPQAIKSNKKTNLKNFFHIFWERAGLTNQTEGSKIYYEVIYQALKKASVTTQYNRQPLNDVLITPYKKSKEEQIEEFISKAKFIEGEASTKIILIGLLNEISFHKESKKIFFYNDVVGVPTIGYYITDYAFRNAKKSIDFDGDCYQFNNKMEGFTWVVAVIEPRLSKNGNYYGTINDIAFIPVTREHVPITNDF